MSKIIRTIIDEKGDIHTDLSGFIGDECVAEEERLRKELQLYGVRISGEKMQLKAAENNAHAFVALKNT